MNKRIPIAAALLFFATPAMAFAGASNFTLVNGTSDPFASMSIKRTGTSDWRPLPASPGPGGASNVAFSDPDCAFDLKVSLPGGRTAEWAGVNLCGTNRLTLRQRPSGETWVDYD
jgi:hypothetical protein